MPHSFATTANLTSPRCQQPFGSELWLIIDLAEDHTIGITIVGEAL